MFVGAQHLVFCGRGGDEASQKSVTIVAIS